MITKNFKAIMAMNLMSNATTYGLCALKGLNGRTYYIDGLFQNFPASRSTGATLAINVGGIYIGSGGTPATEDDFTLEARITSGVVVATTNTDIGSDAQGNPYLIYKITITNSGGETVTIREIGYVQPVKSVRNPGTNSNVSDSYFLLDRTVLDTPVTLQPGAVGVIDYKLQTVIAPARTVAGIEMVSWTFGSDAQIVAMIEAARNGVIDLQRDAGWRVGDVRKVPISAFTGGGDVSYAAQDVGLVISSFEEYEGCGNIMQFDFTDCLDKHQRMNSTNSNVGGYGGSEMYTTTLPALVNALPSWLQGLLKTFSVKVSAGNKSLTIETVTGNKLALRSEVECFGTTSRSAPGEGTQIEYYKNMDPRVKYQGIYTAAQADPYIFRSPDKTSNSNYVGSNQAGSVVAYWSPNAASCGISPFGCI